MAQMVSRKPARMRRAALLAATAAAAAGALALSMVAPVHADERDDALAEQQSSQERVDQLRGELQGLSSDLQQVYIDMALYKEQVPVATEALAAAKEEAATAVRQHQVLEEQLVAAQDELKRLTEEIEQSKVASENAKAAVGEITRNLYRGEPTPVLAVALTGEGTEEIGQRAAAATAASRIQTQALTEATANEQLVKNQAERQDSVTDRVATLEAEAEEAASAAEAAQDAAEKKLNELTTLKATAEKNAKAWEAKKGEAEKQLSEWEARVEKAAAEVARIDEENRASGVSYVAAPTGGNGIFQMPVSGYEITSSFGYRMHPVYGYEKLHNGTDWGVPCGVGQGAIGAGVVSDAGYDSGGGNYVNVNHGMVGGSSYVSEYLHLSEISVGVGQSVGAGQVVGLTGTTGSSTGCHLHLTIYQDGAPIDPLSVM